MSTWQMLRSFPKHCYRALFHLGRTDIRRPGRRNMMSAARSRKTFYGWHVVAAVFVLATFGWGLGFYGPPVYLHAVHESRGWSLNVVSTAVTVHFLFGAIVIANLPRLYRRFGLARVTKAGSLALAIGVAGWALAQEPWQLFVATLFSGG